MAMPNHAGFHPPACHPLCAPVRAMAFPLLPRILSSMTFGYKLPLLPVSSLPMLSAMFNAGARNGIDVEIKFIGLA
ncbi:hypothetical protein ALC60_11000 [Trachymyrmex zeteki]|uniref:Uncharacterized protein n=1 Tax=Mycetomoellerius zeteki TaxID=64791 RepID=A0A151WQ60_9HYME|nr:hypothetical protein ALC60_11000 [Trachymyrmex zeteki]